MQAKVKLAGFDREKLRSLFQIVPIHLGLPTDTDYIAMGRVPLSGADSFWFWLVRSN
jgi:hypothetical protein